MAQAVFLSKMRFQQAPADIVIAINALVGQVLVGQGPTE